MLFFAVMLLGNAPNKRKLQSSPSQNKGAQAHIIYGTLPIYPLLPPLVWQLW